MRVRARKRKNFQLIKLFLFQEYQSQRLKITKLPTIWTFSYLSKEQTKKLIENYQFQGFFVFKKESTKSRTPKLSI